MSAGPREGLFTLLASYLSLGATKAEPGARAGAGARVVTGVGTATGGNSSEAGPSLTLSGGARAEKRPDTLKLMSGDGRSRTQIQGLGQPGQGRGHGDMPRGRSFTSREEGVCGLYQSLDHAHHLDRRHRSCIQLSLVPDTERETQSVTHAEKFRSVTCDRRSQSIWGPVPSSWI